MAHSRQQPSLLTQIAPPLRRGVLLFYVLLLGLWLPFVCWGAWADPAHAHAGPHLVFAEPSTSPSASPYTGAADGHTHSKPPSHDETPTGAARPLISLMPFLLMALWAGYRLRQPARRALWLRPHYPTRSADIAIPTPPPRRRAWSCAGQ